MKIKYIFIAGIIAVVVLVNGCGLLMDRSTLVINNLPDGDYIVRVITISGYIELINTGFKTGWDYKAVSDGRSPFELLWYEKMKAGNYFVTISPGFISDDFPYDYRRGKIIYFNSKGDATTDWNEMQEYIPR